MTWMLLFLYSPPEERTPANGGAGTVCGHRGSSGEGAARHQPIP